MENSTAIAAIIVLLSAVALACTVVLVVHLLRIRRRRQKVEHRMRWNFPAPGGSSRYPDFRGLCRRTSCCRGTRRKLARSRIQSLLWRVVRTT
ncbi:hypothetical protein GGX14DRAFT_470675, partial [Mycena pura]